VLHLVVARDDAERRAVLNAIGPVWDGNEVWLITAAGALFAAFPLVYATVFSGFYLATMFLLGALILRAISIEFRSKETARLWRLGWDVGFSGASALATLLFVSPWATFSAGCRSTPTVPIAAVSADCSIRSRSPSAC